MNQDKELHLEQNEVLKQNACSSAFASWACAGTTLVL